MQEAEAREIPLWRAAGRRSDRDDERSIESQRYIDAERRLVGDLEHSTTVDRRPMNWVVTLHRFEAFTRAEGRTPRENSRIRGSIPGPERRLGEWARYQRRFEDGLCAYQRARLDVSPHFVWDIGNAAWKSRYDSCVTFRVLHARLPLLTNRDNDEFALARWLGRQLKARQLGTLSLERSARIDRLLGLNV
jgi:hypothetical protein